MRHCRWAGGFAFAWLACSPVAASAQATAQIPLHFDFVNPGARSLAMGGAYVAQADDATAAFTNPAGLPQLRKEVSVEPRYRSVDSRFLSGGRLSGRASHVGIDTADKPAYSTDTDNGVVLAFLSAVLPRKRPPPDSAGSDPATDKLATRRNWAFAMYRQQVASLHSSLEDQGPFARLEFPGGGATDDFRISPLRGERRIDISNYGGAFGFQATPQSRPYPWVDVGFGVSVYHGQVEADFTRFLADADAAPASYTEPRAYQTQTADSWVPAFNAGLIVTAAAGVRIGAVYRQGPRFNFVQSDQSATFTTTRSGKFDVPDVLASGLSWQPFATLLLALDVKHVRYSQLLADFVSFQSISTNRIDQLSVPNVTEVHVGAQYSLLGVWARPQVRVGAWSDPDHSVRYTPRVGDIDDLLLAAALPGNANRLHTSVGLGLQFSNRFELNAGADRSPRGRSASLSIIIRAGSVKPAEPPLDVPPVPITPLTVNPERPR